MPAAVIEIRAPFFWSSWNRRYQGPYVHWGGLLEICQHGPTTYFVIPPHKRFDLVISTSSRSGYPLKSHGSFGVVMEAYGKKVNFYRSTEIWISMFIDRFPRKAFYLSLEVDA